MRAAVVARASRSPTVLPPSALSPAGTPGARAEAGARLGTLVHAALACAESLDPAAAEPAVAAAATRLGIAGGPVAAARELVASALASPLYRRAAGARRVLREVPVTAWVAEQLVEGVVDLLFEDEAGLVAVEVKVGPADAAAAAQLAAYVDALAAAACPVAEAWVLALGPAGAEAARIARPRGASGRADGD